MNPSEDSQLGHPPLPSKGMLLEACAGAPPLPHPILLAASELARLHRERRAYEAGHWDDIDCARARLINAVDRWIATTMPPPSGAAGMHTETVGMVVDRIAQLSVHAHAVLATDAPEFKVHDAWKRLAELSIAYSDLSFEISNRTRRLPDSSVQATHLSTYLSLSVHYRLDEHQHRKPVD